MQREERTNMFSLFCAYVIKTAIYMYLCFRRVWSLILQLFSSFYFSPLAFLSHSSRSDKIFSGSFVVKGFIH